MNKEGPLIYTDYLAARNFVEAKSLGLMRHEKKDYAKTGFPIQNYRVHDILGRTFYSVRTNVFREILNDVLLEATGRYPERFGTGNAEDVIKAIYDIEPMFTIDRFVDFLRTEQFCYIFEKVSGDQNNDILRIDLFRKLDKKGDVFDFTGGIFHALKHFSYSGTNLSTGKDVNDITHPAHIITLAIKAFFLETREVISVKEFHSTISVSERYNLRFVFYFEENTAVYFVKTIFKESK